MVQVSGFGCQASNARSSLPSRRSRHSREGGNPACSGDVDPRFRGADEGLTIIPIGEP
jgi:hypothetical protein